MKYILILFSLSTMLFLGSCEQDSYLAEDLEGKWLANEVINSSETISYYMRIDRYPANSNNLVIKNFMGLAGDEDTVNENFMASVRIFGSQFVLNEQQYDDYFLSYSMGQITNNGNQITITYSASLAGSPAEIHTAHFTRLNN